MKISKYLNKTICSILIIIFMFSVFIVNIYAHDSLLDIEYIDYADDEIWFDLNHTLTIVDEKVA